MDAAELAEAEVVLCDVVGEVWELELVSEGYFKGNQLTRLSST